MIPMTRSSKLRFKGLDFIIFIVIHDGLTRKKSTLWNFLVSKRRVLKNNRPIVVQDKKQNSGSHIFGGLLTPKTELRPRASRAMPKRPKFSRVKVPLFFYLFPMGIDEPPFDFITDVRRFFIFKSHRAPRGRVFVRVCFFSTISFRFLCTRPANNAIVATELTPTFCLFAPIKIF